MVAERLVVQLPVSESTDFDSLIDIENALTIAFLDDRAAAVEGHQLGQGRFNLFIAPAAAPGPVVDRLKAALAHDGMPKGTVIARRAGAHEPFVVVWPADYSGTFVL